MEYTGTLTLTRCWYACSAHIMTCGTFFFLRFLYGPWRSMKVIESVKHEESEIPNLLTSKNGSVSAKIEPVMRTINPDNPAHDPLDSQAAKTAG
jgi:hypothetical protein